MFPSLVSLTRLVFLRLLGPDESLRVPLVAWLALMFPSLRVWNKSKLGVEIIGTAIPDWQFFKQMSLP